MSIRVSFKLSDDVQARMKALADARNRYPHLMMCEAITRYVEREEKREALCQEGLYAWDTCQETGLHVTHAEADAWMARLATGDDQESLACHP